MKNIFVYLLTICCSTILVATDAKKKINKSVANGRIHTIKPDLSVSTCDLRVINLSARLYEEALLLRAENEELRNENKSLRSQLAGESLKKGSLTAIKPGR